MKLGIFIKNKDLQRIEQVGMRSATTILQNICKDNDLYCTNPDGSVKTLENGNKKTASRRVTVEMYCNYRKISLEYLQKFIEHI